MKLGWGILSEPDSLWVAVLRSKYVKSDAVIPDLKAKASFRTSVERDLWRMAEGTQGNSMGCRQWRNSPLLVG